jgi:hypothetical protein
MQRGPRTAFPTASPSQRVESLRRRAAGFPLPSSQRAAASLSGVRVLAPDPARRDLSTLAACFCAVYGSSEHAPDGEPIWGEGWRCRSCATERPADADGPCPSCGGRERTAVNDPREIERSLAQALRPRPDWLPVACVLERGGRTVGFAYGAVTTKQRATEQLGRKLREYSAELAGRGLDIDRIDLRPALPAHSPVFFMDELCVELGARSGIDSLKGLAAVLFAGAAELGARGLVGFTSKRAAPFRLIAPGGGELALDLGELVVFRMEDFLPLATLLHHLSSDELIRLLAQAVP